MNRSIKYLFVAALVLVCIRCGQSDDSDNPQSNSECGVVINEINTDAKYIELYNTLPTVCDLSGFTIRKNGTDLLRNASSSADFVVTDGTLLSGFGYAVINCKGADNPTSALVLGTSATGISGKKSLLLELLDRKGSRVDLFCNSAQSAPRAVDRWDSEPEWRFDVAGRSNRTQDRKWWVLSGASLAASNIGADTLRLFTHTSVDFAATTPNDTLSNGAESVFDSSSLPSLHIEVTLAEWNRLLESYDRDNNTDLYVACKVNYVRLADTLSRNNVGLRLRGNTSRRRPESGSGHHNPTSTNWQHCHFGLNFTKLSGDRNDCILGVQRLNLKWFKDDAMYVRELYCFDLFRRFGIWTAIDDIYCRLWLRVEGDPNEVYYGVYEMMEAIDNDFIERRADRFGSPSGNLWKCRYGASLTSTDSGQFGADNDTSTEYRYELKTNTDNFESAKGQLKDFITNLNNLKGDPFYEWIERVCDVELLLRTYAVSVVTGMWDDYWNNTNNYYICFTGDSQTDYRFFFIPYDYDNTLGTSLNCGVQSDSGRQDPLAWGDNSKAPLISKIIALPKYRTIYLDVLRELVDSANPYACYSSSINRIRSWQAQIKDYVSNDTGEDCVIADRPAGWGNHSEYRLLNATNNFFIVKAASVPAK